MNNDWLDELDEILQPAKQEHMELELLRHPRNLESINDDGEMYINYTKQQILDWHEKECERRVLEAKGELVEAMKEKYRYLNPADTPKSLRGFSLVAAVDVIEEYFKELSDE